MRKIYNSKKIEKIDFNEAKKYIKTNKEIFSLLKKIKIEYLNLEIKIGVEDTVLTSYVVAIISSVISIILPYCAENKDAKKYKYAVEPVYNKNTFNLYLDSIVSIKIVHIIYVIYNLIRKGRDKNESTSNRRSYAYGHEFN
jgi:hypothetical protein